MVLTQNSKVLYKLFFNIKTRDTLDCEIVNMFYASRMSFYLARSLYYKSAFSYAANTFNLGKRIIN